MKRSAKREIRRKKKLESLRQRQTLTFSELAKAKPLEIPMTQQSLPLEEKKPKVHRTYLSPKDTFAVTQLVIAEFAEKKTTDENFAEYAKEKLGLSFCTKHHITGIRNEFGIPCEIRKKREKGAIEVSRADLLDKRLTGAEAQIRHLFADIARLEKLVASGSPLDLRLGG